MAAGQPWAVAPARGQGPQGTAKASGLQPKAAAGPGPGGVSACGSCSGSGTVTRTQSRPAPHPTLTAARYPVQQVSARSPLLSRLLPVASACSVSPGPGATGPRCPKCTATPSLQHADVPWRGSRTPAGARARSRLLRGGAHGVATTEQDGLQMRGTPGGGRGLGGHCARSANLCQAGLGCAAGRGWLSLLPGDASSGSWDARRFLGTLSEPAECVWHSGGTNRVCVERGGTISPSLNKEARTEIGLCDTVILEKTRTPSGLCCLPPKPQSPTAHKHTHVRSARQQAEAPQVTVKAVPHWTATAGSPG